MVPVDDDVIDRVNGYTNCFHVRRCRYDLTVDDAGGYETELDDNH